MAARAPNTYHRSRSRAKSRDRSARSSALGVRRDTAEHLRDTNVAIEIRGPLFRCRPLRMSGANFFVQAIRHPHAFDRPKAPPPLLSPGTLDLGERAPATGISEGDEILFPHASSLSRRDGASVGQPARECQDEAEAD